MEMTSFRECVSCSFVKKLVRVHVRSSKFRFEFISNERTNKTNSNPNHESNQFQHTQSCTHAQSICSRLHVLIGIEISTQSARLPSREVTSMLAHISMLIGNEGSDTSCVRNSGPACTRTVMHARSTRARTGVERHCETVDLRQLARLIEHFSRPHFGHEMVLSVRHRHRNIALVVCGCGCACAVHACARVRVREGALTLSVIVSVRPK